MIGDPSCPKCGSLTHSICNYPKSECGRCHEPKHTDSLGFCVRCSAALSLDAPDGPFADPSAAELEAAKVSILGMRPVDRSGPEWIFNDGVIYTALLRFIRARKERFK